MGTGTEQLADDIVAYLRDGVSVNLVGLHCSGRTYIANRVTERLREQGLRIVTVRAVAALRDRPLAALAVAGVDIGSAGATAIPHAVEALSKLMPPGRSALVIDDADDLDSASAGVVAAAHAERLFPVLSVTRPTGRHQSYNHALIDGLRPGVRLRAEPLGFDQLHHVVHALLPGPVDPSTVAQIATLSGGLPGLVYAMVDTGRRTGSIVAEGTIWRARGNLWDDRLVQSVEPLFIDLGDDEAAALTRLALARTVPVAEARDIVSESLFVRLDELGLLEVTDAQTGPLVGVFPPLAAEYLRRAGVAGSHSPAARAGVAEPYARSRRESLTSSRVAVLNTRIAEHWRVEVAALRSVWQAEPTAEHAAALLGALNEAAAEPEEFEAVLKGTPPGAIQTIWDIRLLGWESLYRGVLCRELETARDLLVRGRETSPRFAAELFANEAVLCLAAGIMPDDSLLVPSVSADESARETLDMARRVVLSYAGQTTDALAGLPVGAPDLTDYPPALRMGVLIAHVFHGDFELGIKWALRAVAEAEDRLNAGGILECAYIGGIALVFSGRVDDGQALLDPVLALTGPTMMHEYYHTGVLGLAALAARWRGRKDYCEALTAQAEAVGRRSGPFPEILRVGQPGFAAWDVVAERLQTGHVAAGITLAVEAVEICPDVEGARLAAEYALRTQSPYLAALGRYIEAAAAGDVGLLAACVADLRERGAGLYSVKAGVTRALALRSRGDLAESVRQAEAAWAQAGEHGQVPVGLFFPLGHALGLNPREREIALLLADGLSSQEIATTVGLSYRTVENYLSSAYRKLGSTGRADLVRAVTTWGR